MKDAKGHGSNTRGGLSVVPAHQEAIVNRLRNAVLPAFSNATRAPKFFEWIAQRKRDKRIARGL